MQVLNRLEWLTLTNKRYSGDRLFVIPFDGNDFNKYKVDSMYDLCNRSDNICKELLKIICFCDYLEANDIIIDDTTRIYYYQMLISMYTYEYNKKRRYINNGIKNAKEKGIYKGRKKIKIDPLFFDRVMNDYLSKEITANEAAKLLKISLSTFFRRIKEKNKN